MGETDARSIEMIHNNNFSHWLLTGIVCLLVGGTFAAKTVFLVDNDLENQTEFSGKNWQLDRKNARRYTDKIERFAVQYIDRLRRSRKIFSISPVNTLPRELRGS